MSMEACKRDWARPRILYIQYTDPAAYPPLDHSSSILAEAGWDVRFMGTQARGIDPLQLTPHERIRVKKIRSCPPGLLQKAHYLWYSASVIEQVQRWRPDWVYASDSLSAPLGLALALLTRARIIYHEHDSPAFAESWFTRLVQWARGALARRADLCILPNPDRADRFASETSRSDVVCVWNCPKKIEASFPRPAESDEEMSVLYQGSIVPTRLPASVLEALASMPDRIKLNIVGYETIGHTGYVDELKRIVQRLRLDNRVAFLGPMARKDMLDVARRCHVGLSLVPKQSSDVNFRSMIGASNKAFEYLACGLALIVPDRDEWKRMYVQPGYGLAVDPEDPKSISEALRWFFKNPTDRRAMGDRGRQKILNDWNYETQFAPVRERIGIRKSGNGC